MAAKDNKKLFKNMSECKVVDDCYAKKAGKKELPQPLPVVISNNGKPEIMVITEQPAKSLIKDIIKHREEIGKKIGNKSVLKMNLTELRNIRDKDLWQKIAWGRFVTVRSGLPPKLRKFLGKDFWDSIEKNSGKYYWAHYIKCPGQIRGKKGINKNAKEACANKHLAKEILTLKPKLILTFGASPSSWILKFREDPSAKKWLDYFWDELREVFEYEKSGKKQDLETMLQNLSKIRITVEGRDIPVCVFYHPSGANPAAYITGKIFEVLSNLIVSSTD